MRIDFSAKRHMVIDAATVMKIPWADTRSPHLVEVHAYALMTLFFDLSRAVALASEYQPIIYMNDTLPV
jgi:hypothetical protein